MSSFLNSSTRPSPTSFAKQHLRYFKGYSLLNNEGRQWPTSEGGDIQDSMLPGPTLRARVGDQVQLAFFNQINLQNFPFSLDRAERGYTDACDEARASRKNSPRESRQIYPNNPNQTPGDSMPNCLHGSSTANIHFHGTHTTPSTTGDNVLLFVRPALREPDGNIIGPIKSNVMEQFEEFWSEFPEGSPTNWSQLPEPWRRNQKALIERYDSMAPYEGVVENLPENMKLWPANQANLDKGLWPQYSLGAFPYNFHLPKYEPEKMKMGQAPGTHWYHAHKHGSTALNVSNGMAGAFIIEGPYDNELQEFYNDNLKEHVLVIQQYETALNLLSAGNRNQTSPPPLSVNGRVNPVVTMRPGEVQMWRIVNANARTFVQFDSFDSRGGSTVEWRQIAQDGVQFSYENYERFGSLNRKFNLAAANRADLLVKAPAHESDYVLTVVPSVSDVPSNPPVTLLTVRVEGENTPMDFIQNEADFPKLPPYLDDLPRQQIYTQRKLVYNTDPSPGRAGAGKMPKHKINGKQFNGDFINVSMTLNTVEEWTVINKTVGIAHPFHIHINPFQIVEVFQPNIEQGLDPLDPSTWKPSQKLTAPFVWWDVFAIPTAKEVDLPEEYKKREDCPAEVREYTTCKDGKCSVKIPGYFKMRSWFADFTGVFVNHCHILAHEDRGMMQLIQVVSKPANPYRHN